MTVSVAPRFANFNGLGVVGAYTFNFYVLLQDDNVTPYITVTKISAAGVPTVLNYPADYSFVPLSLGQGGGGVTPLVAIPNDGSRLFVAGATPLDQAVGYRNQGPDTTQKYERSFDKLTLIAQEAVNANSTAIRIPTTDVTGTNVILPSALQRANMTLGFDGTGNVLVGAVSTVVVSAAMIPVVQATTTFIGAKLLLNGNINSVAAAVVDTNVFSQLTTSVNSYAQSIWQNTSNTAVASADLVIGNNAMTSTTNYVNLGMNSASFTGTGSLNKPSAGYLTSTSGDMVVGTTTANALRFVYNSGTTDAGFLDNTGWNFLTGAIIQTNSVNGTTSIQINNTNAGTSTSAQLVLNNGTTLTQFVHTGASATTPNSFFISSGTAGERLRFDSSGRILLGGAAVATGYTNAGDVTLGVSNNIRANNTAKAWIEMTGIGSAALVMGFNISSVTRVSTGVYQVNMTNAVGGGTAYPVVTGVNNSSTTIGDRQVCSNVTSSSQFYLVCGLTASASVFDSANIMAVVYANQ